MKGIKKNRRKGVGKKRISFAVHCFAKLKKQMVIKSLNQLFGKFGYKIVKDDFREQYAEFIDIYDFCKPYTMTSVERMYALYKGVEYVVKNNIPGDFVECGVWKGGSSMLIAKTLQKFGVSDRKIWMYDTYEGMSEPSEEDKDVAGAAAHEIWEKLRIDNKSGWCVSNIEEVKENIRITGYTFHQFQFIQGHPCALTQSLDVC
jgi:hypothetical protein